MQLLTIDKHSHAKLLADIEATRANGYEVSIGQTEDAAYDKPEKIQQVYEFLRELDAELSEDRRRFIARGVGRVGLNPLKRSLNKERAIDNMLDPIRVQRLYAPNRAVPWHEQRGRAAALLAIASAHELQVDSNATTGRYETMSGPLDISVLTYVFDESAPRLQGMTVRDALLYGEERFNKKTGEIAEQRVDQRLAQMEEYITAAVSPVFKDVVQYSTDALGIRSRKAEVHTAIKQHLLARQEHDGTSHEYLMMSFGCGTALPMLEVVKDLRDNHGIATRLLLLDQDPLALASAACLADSMGVGDTIEMHCEQLFNRIGQPIKLGTVLGSRKLDVAEDSGLREYLPDMIYRWLTRESWHSLRHGGLMTTGNMNSNRPQAEFLRGMMGWWPPVRMRTIADGTRLHREAGIPAQATRVRVTQDGVYTMYFTEKQ